MLQAVGPGSSMHKLSLPMCTSLTMLGSRDLNRIEIKAPELDCLDLQVLEAHPVSACAAAPRSSPIRPDALEQPDS